ncbi:MAG: glycosyltransferase family 2 protein [bacterium]
MNYILLPVYNEEKSLVELFDSYIRVGFDKNSHKIVLVDDGSTDSTVKIVKKYQEKLPINLIRHEKNLGLGKAISTGFSNIGKTLQNGDVIITLDADNTHPLELIPVMLEEIRNGSDIVVASRYCDGGKETGVKFYRKLLSLCANNLLRILFPHRPLRDYSSGYRAYSGKIILLYKNKLNLKLAEETGFSVMAEIIIKLSMLNPVVSEIPLELKYMNKIGKSKIKILQTIKRYIVLILKLRRMKKSLQNS